MISKPSISVIIPVYNCAQYLPQCLDSLLAQTFKNFELIMVDDGSTDGTLELEKKYALKYENFFVMEQQHSYAGVARNVGIDCAKGDYLLFLDGDDYFEETLLEESLARIEETAADICVFGSFSLDDRTGNIKLKPHTCRANLCPSQGTFNRKTNPRYIYSFTTPAPWTKLFKRSFIAENNLYFQDTRSSNDTRFVFMALSLADRIAVLDKPLVVYRQHTGSSLQVTQYKDPLAFYRALVSLSVELEKCGLMTELRYPFVNFALDNCIYNLTMLEGDSAAHELVFQLLKNEAFDRFEISGKPQEYFYTYPASRYENYKKIVSMSYGEYVAAIQKEKNTKRGSNMKKILRKIKSFFLCIREKDYK